MPNLPDEPADTSRPRSVQDILAHANEIADRFESADYDGVALSPRDYFAQIKVQRPRS